MLQLRVGAELTKSMTVWVGPGQQQSKERVMRTYAMCSCTRYRLALQAGLVEASNSLKEVCRVELTPDLEPEQAERPDLRATVSNWTAIASTGTHDVLQKEVDNLEGQSGQLGT